MNIAQLLDARVHGLTVKGVIDIIVHSEDNGYLNSEVKLALAYLFQKEHKKACRATTINPKKPFSIAAYFSKYNDARNYLNYIKSENGELTASNGHVIVRIKHQLEDGYYDQIGNKIYDLDIFKFPSITKLTCQLDEREPVCIDSYTDFKGNALFGKALFNIDYINQMQKSGVGLLQIYDSFCIGRIHDGYIIVMSMRH